MYRTGIS